MQNPPAYPEAPPAEEQARLAGQMRPTGVLLMAVLCLVAVAVIGVYAAEAVLVLRDPGTREDASAARTTLMLALGLAPLFMAMSIGLWRLMNWARLLAIGFLAVAIGSFFADVLSRYPLGTALLLGLNRGLIPGAMMLYLLHPSIAAVFDAKAAQASGC